MLAFRVLISLAAITGALANPLEARQTTNTNGAIHNIITILDKQIHTTIPTILTLQANHTATDGTIGNQMNALISDFTTAASSLTNTPVSIGSTTVSPTNDENSIAFADVMQQVATGLSGLTPTVVPTFTSMISRLDPAVASALNAFNTTLPGSIALVHILMLDAQQFLVKEGAWPQTLHALGFT